MILETKSHSPLPSHAPVSPTFLSTDTGGGIAGVGYNCMGTPGSQYQGEIYLNVRCIQWIKDVPSSEQLTRDGMGRDGSSKL